MFNNVHIIAVAPTSDDISEWDVRTVEGGEFIGVIEKVEGPEGIDELASYWFTDTFGHQEEFDSIYDARDYAEQSINPVTVN
ncbi:hypothetical protein LCGC14_1039170 [marine sediment metagenome]|uniref:Uncharacterized protein n=1 Tax=marine sediment metagenome TaxID=412755 RepID=A0A0F9MWQ5_9ZZZZ